MSQRVWSHVRGNVVGYLALFIALGGTGYAATILPHNSVGTKQLKNRAVTGKKVAKHTLTARNIKISSLGLQSRVNGTCSGNSAISTIASSGSVTCQPFGTGNGNGTVTSVDSGTGLSGGPITGSGTLSLASTYRLPQSCNSGQVAKSDGSGAWNCAADQNSGGTVTSVDSGTGLTGGPITGSGSLQLASGYRLPQSCTSGQVPSSDGSGNWSCTTETSVTQMMGGSAGVVSGAGTSYLAASGLSSANVTEANVSVGAPAVQTVAGNLQVSVSPAPAPPGAWFFGLVVNGQLSNLTCIARTSCTNTSETVTIPAGATVSLEATGSLGPPNARVTFSWSDTT